MSALTPALFLGHGNPMNAITDNPWRRAWTELARRLPGPQAILCISAHWESASPEVCAADPPRTIHDFYGFPDELFAQRYPAPGAPGLAARIAETVGGAVAVTDHWGLDHGGWALLLSLFPQAAIPVCQLSLGRSLTPAGHFDLARRLAPLRQEGVMLLASGNIVHNLRRLTRGEPPRWAREFDDYVTHAIWTGDDQALIDYTAAGQCAAMSVPTPEHYLPLLYALGVRRPEEPVEFVAEGFDLGSVDMRGVVVGAPE